MRFVARLGDARVVRALPIVLGVAAFLLAARNLIGTYADLGIYLDVARELRQGGFDLCRAREASGPWAYPPCAALPFAALQWLLADAGARWAWCALLGLGTALLVVDLRRALAPWGGLRPWQWLVFAALFGRCIAQNLTHGQLSLWVGVAVLRGTVQLQRGRDLRAGVWFGLGAALKLTPILFAVALPFMQRRRAAAATAATAVAAICLLPWPLLGTAEHWRHLGDFGSHTLAPLLGLGPPQFAEFYAGPSIAGTLDHLLTARPVDQDGHLVNVLDLGPAALRTVKLLWSLLLAGLLLWWFRRARHEQPPRRLLQQAAVVMLAIAFFSPLTRVYHLAAALAAFALFCRGPARGRDWLWWCTAVALLLAMTLRQKHLLGETLWRTLDNGGLLHFALIALVVWLLRATPKGPAAVDASGTTRGTASRTAPRSSPCRPAP